MGTISATTEVVVPLDGRASSRALAVAERCAARLGWTIRLLSISDDEQTAWTRLDDLAASARDAGREVTIDVRTADSPAEGIVAATGDTALLCLATAATVRPHDGHIGSVAENVVRRIGQPVILVGPKAEVETNLARVIVPVDGSDLAERSLAVAGDVASTLGLPVWVVSVVSPRNEEIAADQLDHLIATESGYVRRLASQLEREHGVDASFEVLHMDDPATAIVDFAGDDGVVVMSTHGRSGLSRLIAGSVALRVVADSKSPVVVWRPDGD